MNSVDSQESWTNSNIEELLRSYCVTLVIKETVERGATKSSNTNLSISLIEEEVRRLPPVPESEWAISISEKNEQAKQENSACPRNKLSIFRVPRSLREGDEKAYVPQVVSIGPFHRGNIWLQDMEQHKWRSLHQVLRRTCHDVHLYLESVRSDEAKARECYEGQIPISSDELVECMVLDGCFMLELFRGAVGEGFKSLGYCPHDPFFSKRGMRRAVQRGMMHALQRDMIMLQNQIPLFVLDRLWSLQHGSQYLSDNASVVLPLIFSFFDPLIPNVVESFGKAILNVKVKETELRPVYCPLSDVGSNCLDVFHRNLLYDSVPLVRRNVLPKPRSPTTRVTDCGGKKLIHCVTELLSVDIKFERNETYRFWHVQFDHGKLRIPRIRIDDGTKSLFLNLIAWEHCQIEIGNITSYVIFMHNLITSADDVRHLHNCGIIDNWLGNDGEVADLFNRLGQETMFDINDNYLSGMSEQLNRYYDHRWNKWRATLKHNYFGNPWTIISLVAAVFLLLLTTVQTFYTVYPYYRPHG